MVHNGKSVVISDGYSKRTQESIYLKMSGIGGKFPALMTQFGI